MYMLTQKVTTYQTVQLFGQNKTCIPNVAKFKYSLKTVHYFVAHPVHANPMNYLYVGRQFLLFPSRQSYLAVAPDTTHTQNTLDSSLINNNIHIICVIRLLLIKYDTK